MLIQVHSNCKKDNKMIHLSFLVPPVLIINFKKY